MPRLAHFEISADDPERLAGFYRRIFGWDITVHPSLAGYQFIQATTQHDVNGGIVRRDSLPTGAGLNIYEVDDVPTAIDQIIDAGGTLLRPLRVIPDVGHLAYLADPQGNPFGVITHSLPAAAADELVSS